MRGSSKVWTDATNDHLWSTPGNRLPAGVPGASDVAVFNGVNTNNNCQLSGIAPAINGIDATAGYTGQILFGSATVTIQSFVITQGKLSTSSAGLLDAGSSKLIFKANVIVNTAAPVNELELQSAAFITLQANLTVAGDLTLTDVSGQGEAGKKLIALKNIIATDAGFTGNNGGPISLQGNTDQTSSGGGAIAWLEVAKSGAMSCSQTICCSATAARLTVASATAVAG